MFDYKVSIPTYYTKNRIENIRFLLNNLKGLEIVREDVSKDIHNDDWIEIYVKFADVKIIHCLETLAGFGVFDVYSVGYNQTNLFE